MAKVGEATGGWNGSGSMGLGGRLERAGEFHHSFHPSPYVTPVAVRLFLDPSTVEADSARPLS